MDDIETRARYLADGLGYSPLHVKLANGSCGLKLMERKKFPTWKERVDRKFEMRCCFNTEGPHDEVWLRALKFMVTR